MKAVLIKKPGGPEKLSLGAFRRPKHTREEVLVRVEATAINRADLLQRKRHPGVPRPYCLCQLRWERSRERSQVQTVGASPRPVKSSEDAVSSPA